MSNEPSDTLHNAFNERDGFKLDDIIEVYNHARELKRENARLQEEIKKLKQQLFEKREQLADALGWGARQPETAPRPSRSKFGPKQP